MSRRWITLMIFSAVMALAVFASPAGASHAGAIANCGTAGTFTVKATTNHADFQSPAPDKLILFEEGGVLTVRRLYVNGQLVLTRGATVPHEATCTFTLGDGPTLTVIGTLAGV